ncbi:phage tail family protein [Paenibacillus alvei]|uniref:phage tail domain-containing protein n=1 Tax=Paenibacillus alvei TaxID=44250 RepID=UPI0022806270|nr:phage tail domain-containing protein [Paenibacillus alvei]MCY9758376.1 phage tail family protein [Paenibacillus alvei]
MLEGIHFSYDGVHSVDMGLLNCKIDGGMFEETFLPSRSIVETKVAGRDKPYFQSIEMEPLSFELTFAFENNYTERQIREVARWLFQPYYKPFYTVDNPNRVFYCMVDGDSTLIHNGWKQGYITLTMRCEDAYSYTPEYIRNQMELNGSKITKTIVEDTFSNGTGSMTDIKVVNGKMTVQPTVKTWRSFAGKKWSDL